MSYKIEYTSAQCVKRPLRRKKRGLIIGIVAALFSVSLLHPKVRLGLQDAILPGDDAVTASALGSLVTDLKEGETVTDAVSAFCMTVITESGT